MHLARLWSVEVFFYFAVYIVYLCYGLGAMLSVRDRILEISKYEFVPGWSVLGRPRDDHNDELGNFDQYMTTMWPWYLLHALASTLLLAWKPTRRSTGHIVVAVVSLMCTLRLVSVALLALLLFTYYAVSLGESKALTWLLSGVWVLTINWLKHNATLREQLGYTEYFTLIVMLSWCMLRGCSYVLNRLQDAHKQSSLYTMERYVGYMLYLPTLVYGPLLTFKRYAVLTEEQPLPGRLRAFSWELLRVAVWWLCLQVALHYLYIHYMTRDIRALELVRHTFSHHAVGYFMGQFFFLYYVITYGLGIAFARYDGLNPPLRPRCIGRIHFYSDMWKYFDEGLYELLFRHIYAELCTRQSPVWRKLLATLATFGFVFLWHGCYLYVCTWCVLNIGCLVAEKCFRAAIKSQHYTHFVAKYLTAAGTQRLNALLATQIFIPAAFSNVYFIGGQDVGNLLMKGAYCSGVANYIALTFCSYCFFQCSEVILRRTAQMNKKRL